MYRCMGMRRICIDDSEKREIHSAECAEEPHEMCGYFFLLHTAATHTPRNDSIFSMIYITHNHPHTSKNLKLPTQQKRERERERNKVHIIPSFPFLF